MLGGGDQAADRVVPDCYRAWSAGGTVRLRRPGATRPWQHVLEPLSGYLDLAARGRADAAGASAPAGGAPAACNFGPDAGSVRPVEALVGMLAGRAPGRRWERDAGETPHEAHALALAIDRARRELGWAPRLSFDDTVAWTDAAYSRPAADLPALVVRQIADYEARRPAAAA